MLWKGLLYYSIRVIVQPIRRKDAQSFLTV